MRNRQENATVNESTVDQEFTVENSDSNSGAKENLVNWEILERCFFERIDSEVGKTVDIVEDGIRNTILTGFVTIITPKIKVANRSINASFG